MAAYAATTGQGVPRTHDHAIDLNWLAVLAAAVSAFVLGGLWYGPLFKNAWCREAGIDPMRRRRTRRGSSASRSCAA